MTGNVHALRGTRGKVKAFFSTKEARWVYVFVAAYLAAYVALLLLRVMLILLGAAAL